MSRQELRGGGVGYTVVWCVGLAIFSSSTTVSSSGRELLRQYAGHAPVLAMQFLLTQGLAAVLLGIVIAGWAALARGAERTLIRCAGGTAVLVSLVQCTVGTVLAVATVPARDAPEVGALTSDLNRLDGLKMLLLAVVLGSLANGRGISRPRWVAVLCGSATVALLVSAIGYGLLLDGPAMAAFLSLPLLLASVTTGAFVIAPLPAADERMARFQDAGGSVAQGERARHTLLGPYN